MTLFRPLYSPTKAGRLSAVGLAIAVPLLLAAVACTTDTTTGTRSVSISEPTASAESNGAENTEVAGSEVPDTNDSSTKSDPTGKAADPVSTDDQIDADDQADGPTIPLPVDGSHQFWGPTAEVAVAEQDPVDRFFRDTTHWSLAPDDGFESDAPVDPIFTPDSNHVWFSIADPTGPTCDGDTGYQLAIAKIRGTIRIAEPGDEVPRNVRRIHHGPDGRVLIEHGCDQFELTLGNVTPDGNFTALRPVPGLYPINNAWDPSWIWVDETEPTTYDPYAEPSLFIRLPHRYDGQELAELFISWDSGLVEAASTGHQEVDDALDFDVAAGAWLQEMEDRRTGRQVNEVKIQPAGMAQPQQALIAGPDGLVLVSSRGRGETPWRSTFETEPVNDAAWSPEGTTFAWVTDAGATVQSLTTIGQLKLSTSGATAIEFSPNGRSVARVSPADVLIVTTFADADLDNPPLEAGRIPAWEVLSSEGLGPLRIGMLVSELEQTLGYELKIDSFGDPVPGACAWISDLNVPGMWMLAEVTDNGDAEIRRISVFAGPWRTPSGLHVGSTEDDIITTLGSTNLDVTPHTYVQGKYLRYLPQDSDAVNSVQFDTNNKAATQIHVGDANWIRYVEGCL